MEHSETIKNKYSNKVFHSKKKIYPHENFFHLEFFYISRLIHKIKNLNIFQKAYQKIPEISDKKIQCIFLIILKLKESYQVAK